MISPVISIYSFEFPVSLCFLPYLSQYLNPYLSTLYFVLSLFVLLFPPSFCLPFLSGLSPILFPFPPISFPAWPLLFPLPSLFLPLSFSLSFPLFPSFPFFFFFHFPFLSPSLFFPFPPSFPFPFPVHFLP